MADNDKLLEMLNVDSGYGEIEVLRDVSIYAEEAQIVSIIGANGAGKSTLLKTLFGIVQPTRGQVLFMGEEISKKPPLDRLNSGISYVP